MFDTTKSKRLLMVGVLLRLCMLSLVKGQVCYFPDGTVAADHKPCSQAGGACCYSANDAHRDACYSNGLCQSLWFGRIYRGACTDKAWGSSCPSVCTDGTLANGGVALRSCLTPAFWCCDLGDMKHDCCAEGKGIVWNNATLVNYALAPRQTDYTFELTAGGYTSILAATAAASSIGARIASSSSSSSVATTNPSTATTSPSTATSDPSSTPTYTCPSTPGVAVAAGLGAGLGVPLIAVSAALLWMLAKQRYYRSQSTVSTHQETQRKTIVPTRHEPDDVKYEIADGQRTWNKPELSAEERRMAAELS
ncbi:hypothetical protein PG984_008382 [Apiospora sp. TS-2023a]